ncbi:signal transduction histidine kinase sporulation regulator spoob [Lucifera butyrica]|uniref:histidine kinase n=1 Tax=Lucifera butyrica TaxID=1351585 RepID=A0A498R7N3_9FIRM|nr:ATP-binding protein [Lucifera butyrica]VBB05138.1 signal transduction histidine kinase sporulation regulator spoob [Lucifera butyrica]
MPELNLAMILFVSFPEVMVLAWLSLSLLGLNPNFRQILRIGYLQSIFDVFLFLVVGKLIAIPFGVHTILELMVFAAILKWTMQISYKSSFLAILLGFSIYTSIETLSTALFAAVSPISVISPNNWLMEIPYLYIKFTFTVLVTFLLRRFNIQVADEWESLGSNRFLLVAGLLFIQSLLLAIFCWRYFLQYKEFFLPIYFYFYFLIVNVILPIISVIVIRQFAILFKKDIGSKAQLDTLRHVEELLHTVRIQRHDFNHELQVVYGLLRVQAFPEARDYLKKSVSEVAATSELVKTDNVGVTALLYTKTGMAEARKVDLRITVAASLRQLPLEARDINLILGNLIDNALDAVELLPILDRKVDVFIGQDLAGYVLEVKNTGPPIPAATVAKIFTPGFSTKGEGRGMGLYSIKKLVQKYHGDVRVISENNGTCFKVVIPIE